MTIQRWHGHPPTPSTIKSKKYHIYPLLYYCIIDQTPNKKDKLLLPVYSNSNDVRKRPHDPSKTHQHTNLIQEFGDVTPVWSATQEDKS